MARFLFAPGVAQDLEEIRDYISADSIENARKMMVAFVEAFRLLADRPALGHRRSDLTQSPLRFWPVGSYLVVYRENQSPIEIVAVIHGSRDVPALLGKRL